MPSFTVFRPVATFGTLCGVVVASLALLIAAVLLLKALAMEVSTSQIPPFVAAAVFVGLAALYAYWTWGCFTLSYIIDRNSLSIRWGGLRQVIPIGNIEALVPAVAGEPLQIEGVSWVGHHVGRATVEPFGEVLFYSSHREPDEVLYVQTPWEVYAISVPDNDAFAAALEAHRERGILFEQRQAVHRWGIAAQSFWLDPTARVLTLVLIGAFLVVLAYVLDTYPDLSQTVRLRFPSLGGIIQVSDKSQLLDIPRSALGFAAVNLGLAVLLHGWERMVSYVLLLAAITIQIVLLVAAIVAVA